MLASSIIQKSNVKITGNGAKTLVFAHGFGCDQNMWRFIAPRFEQKYKVVLFDLVGSGKSDSSAYSFEKYNNLSGYTADLIELIEKLDLKKVLFIGHSVSCMIGILAANVRPDLFEKLILVGPSPRYLNAPNYLGGFSDEDLNELFESMESNYLGWSAEIAPIIMDNPDRPELSDELKNSFCRTNPSIAKHFAKVTFSSDNRADLEKVSLPTLIIQTKIDAIAPIEVGEFVHKHIKNSVFVLLDSVGHCPHISDPEATFEVIKSFLNT